ncbi:MAG: orotidine-5'-phosphate decarboxylase [Dysgonamonadaceae bacterium]|jgi:orotidine-5'-phosphate decarboxylase|nr:orotidine-5'-phosphate decarboxylase [Dysgonamonadaceae bacterium]
MTKQQLFNNIMDKRSFLCVGLDPDIEKIPDHLQNVDEPLIDFIQAIVDATAPYCVAYKLNLAFYENYGAIGMLALDESAAYIRRTYPDKFLIVDGKRGDIANTSEIYAASYFDEMNFHAMTVSPYMGEDSVRPFLEYRDKWTILLALTSNKGSQDFQLSEDANGERLFEKVIRKSQEWVPDSDRQLMYVVGATQGKLLEDVRKIAPDHFLLVPGIGVQGGSLAEVVRYGMNRQCGLLVNSSRQIIYADKSKRFDKTAAEKAKTIQREMAGYLKTLKA